MKKYICGNSLRKGKIKEKKGITFLILVVTIIFILIISSTLTLTFFSVLDSTNKKEYANELNSIQKLVDQYEFINGEYPISQSPVIFSLSRLTADERIQFSEEPGYDDNEVILWELDLVKVGADSVTRGIRRNDNEKDIYAVSENTGKVYYLKGEEYDGIKYYTIEENLKDSLGI